MSGIHVHEENLGALLDFIDQIMADEPTDEQVSFRLIECKKKFVKDLSLRGIIKEPIEPVTTPEKPDSGKAV